MSKTIILHDDRLEILEEGYNIIEKTIYDETLVEIIARAIEERV